MSDPLAPEGYVWWHGVPVQDQERWRAIFSQRASRHLDLPTPCPVCGARTLHSYYGRPPGDAPADAPPQEARGPDAGWWAWCSTCRSYEHSSARYPAGYTCDLDVDWRRVGHAPDAIEEARLAHVYRDPSIVDADEQAMRSIAASETRDMRLADFAAALAAAGREERAAAVVRSILHPLVRARAFDLVATNLVRRGHAAAAQGLLAEAEAVVPAIDARWRQALALARMATVYLESGAREDAARVRDAAIVLAQRDASSAGPDDREAAARVLAELAEDLARAGQGGRARALAKSVIDPRWREVALNAVGRAVRRHRRLTSARHRRVGDEQTDTRALSSD